MQTNEIIFSVTVDPEGGFIAHTMPKLQIDVFCTSFLGN